MVRRNKNIASAWVRAVERSWQLGSRRSAKVLGRALAHVAEQRRAPPGEGDWLPGLATAPGGMRRFRLFRPPGAHFGERLPLLVMLHGCGQDARSFAAVTRMNRLAARERFLVLYPEQDRLANPQGCWNWFDTRSGRAGREAALILAAIDQVCLLHPADRQRVALVGLSAGASMAALLAIRHPERFRAVVMHSGLPPGAADSRIGALKAMQGQRSAMTRVAEGAPQDPVDWPPLMVIHGSEDAIVAGDNAHAAAALWAQAASARAGVARTVQRGQRYPMTVIDFKRRGGGLAARLVEIGGLAHAWSGGTPGEPYADGQGPDASRMVWTFVARQFAGAA